MGTLQLTAERHIALRNGAFGFELPEPLQGSINVAATSLGSAFRPPDIAGQEYLADGLTAIGHYFSTPRVHQTGPGKLEPVIELAGDQPVDVIGFSFHPFGLQDGQPAQRNAQEVAVALSLDGQEFERGNKNRVVSAYARAIVCLAAGKAGPVCPTHPRRQSRYQHRDPWRVEGVGRAGID